MARLTPGCGPSINILHTMAMTHSYEILPLTDPALIRAFLGVDPALTAYALGDLDPAFWPQSEFVGAFDQHELAAVVLLYHGLDPTILTAFGELAGMRAILDAVTLPDEIYYLLPEETAGLVPAYYTMPDPHCEWRMVLDAARFAAPDVSAAKQLEPGHAGVLGALYRRAAGPGEAIVAFSPAQIVQGRFYGVWVGGELVAAAGTHIWSPGERIAAIGNVFTRPDHRGHGYATQCTAAVVRDALADGLQTIVLNVRQDNAAAIRVYEKLGFWCYHVFIEGPGLLHREE